MPVAERHTTSILSAETSDRSGAIAPPAGPPGSEGLWSAAPAADAPPARLAGLVSRMLVWAARLSGNVALKGWDLTLNSRHKMFFAHALLLPFFLAGTWFEVRAR